MQVHQFGERGLDFRQLIERVAESLQLLCVLDRVVRRWLITREGDLELATPLLGAATARIVDDEPAHGARGIGQKTRPIGKRDVFASCDVEIGLV